MITVDEHRARILAATRPLPAAECDVADAQGLVLAADVVSRWPVPLFDNSDLLLDLTRDAAHAVVRPAGPRTRVMDARVGPVRLAWARGAEHRATGRRLLMELLTDAGLAEDTIQQRCAHCGRIDHGALSTASGRAVVGVSYAGDLAVAAIARSTDAAALGIDAEPVRSPEPMGELAALFAPAPPPGIRDWTAIEAVVKADGRGLRIAPGDVRIDEGPSLPWRTARIPDGTRFDVADAPAPAGYAISVAIRPAAKSPQGSANPDPESAR